MSFVTDNLDEFKESLLFLHIQELRDICIDFTGDKSGNKVLLIQRILHFFKTGKVLKQLSIPPISCADKKKLYPLNPQTLILKGSYKNDLKTRNFFKSLIGSHFHFTAYAIDWINERWLQGNPPTYQEYATMWQQEYERRKHSPAKPKEEWKYINFIQDYMKKHPDAPRDQSLTAWELERQRHKKIVENFVKNYKKHE